jgi:drug/metabolite transporter (DMT)-like permease
MTQLLAIASAALFGVADFTGGLATRKLNPWLVAAWSQSLGVPILLVGLLIVESTEVTQPDLVWGAVGGLFGIAGLAVMYATLAAGVMSVIAPIIGAGAAGIPVLWAVATGETIGPVQWFGIAAAGVAVIVLSAQKGHGRVTGRLLGQALLAAVGFAVFFIALGQTNEASGLWPLVAARVVTIPIAFTMMLLLSKHQRTPATAWGLVVTTGMFDMAANVAIVLAVQRGPLGINAVLGSLYPVFTIIAAMIVLKERPTVVQKAAMVLALVAILLLAL